MMEPSFVVRCRLDTVRESIAQTVVYGCVYVCVCMLRMIIPESEAFRGTVDIRQHTTGPVLWRFMLRFDQASTVP